MDDGRRFASVWLPFWAAEAWLRRHEPAGATDPRPLALILSGPHGLALAALDARAQAEGLWPGQPLTDARALVPPLRTAPHEPEATAAHLGRLADWCDRFSPAVAIDGADALMLDISGCAHLFGGEEALLAQMRARLSQQNLSVRLAIADSPAAAWAWARYGDGGVLPHGAGRQLLAALPIAALRLPQALVAALNRVGLRRIADLMALPRGPTSLRFGREVMHRLDQALGVAAEPLALRRLAPRFYRRLAFTEPLGLRVSVDAALALLLKGLCADLESAGQGARRMILAVLRVDGARQEFAIGTSLATRDPVHLARLFVQPLDGLDPGFGIELAELTAPVTQPFNGRQTDLERGGAEGMGGAGGGEGVARLVDRLSQRLGARAVYRQVPVASHWPDFAVRPGPAISPALTTASWPAGVPRPVSLLLRPEPVAAEPESVPTLQAPVAFRWRGGRHVVVAAQGPERIGPEWWRMPPDETAQEPPPRDYWQVEDAQGRRFWLFCVVAGWFVHGVFA
jgi:protein ImuB